MASAETYNARKAGTLWVWAQLPSHMRDHRANPTAFAKRVRVFQANHHLAADGKLGPKTLEVIWSIWPPPAAAPISAPAEPVQKAKTKAKKSGGPGGKLAVDGKEEDVPLP